jgi:hypothetical protein
LAAAIVLTLLAPANPASAQGPVEQEEGGVELRSIDLATVRIFGVMGVSEAKVTGRVTKTERIVASVDSGHGSGVVVDGNVILTAKHVVQHAEILAVKAPGDDRVYPARVIYQDPDHDIAFVAVDRPLPHRMTLPTKVRQLRAGERVFASGYPLDATQETPALSAGQVSRKSNDGLYQLSMSINPGNSGGPVTDEKGALLGIVVKGADPSHGAQGIALAEPLKAILDAYRAVSPASKSQSFTDADASIAATAYELARTGPLGIATDEKVERKLSDITESSQPLVLALMAGLRWNVLVGLLEKRGVARVVDLTDRHEQEVAGELLGETVGLCRKAISIDPSLSERSGFVKDVLDAAAAWDREAKSGGDGAVVTGNAPCDSPQCREHHEKRPRVSIDLAAATTFEGSGVLAQLGFLGDVVRFGRDHVGVTLGGDGSIGTWRSGAVALASADAGMRVNAGGHIGVTAGAYYTPTFVHAEGRSMFTFRSYRTSGGVYVGPWTFGVAWQEVGRGADSTLRTLGGYFERGF